MSATKVLDVVVVGGGLSGLLIAHGLRKTNTDWILLDARDILGGRLVNDTHGDGIDLGGAWIWPEHQPYITRLVASLGLKTFQQPDDPSSTRIAGGAVQIINQLAESLPKDRIKCNKPILYCSQQPPDEICSDSHYVRLETANQEMIYARRVVFAAPPKLLSRHVFFNPPLSEEKNIAMAVSRTWMAGVTKIALVYPEKFWDSTSSNVELGCDGPAFQMYDASSMDGNVSALTFFTHIPSKSPAITDDDVLASMVSAQLADTWAYLQRNDLASQAHTYNRYHVQRWPLDIYISEHDKPKSIAPHPEPLKALSKNEWGNTLFFAGSETDRKSPGVMEGAVGSALRVLQDLEKALAIDYFQQALGTGPSTMAKRRPEPAKRRIVTDIGYDQQGASTGLSPAPTIANERPAESVDGVIPDSARRSSDSGTKRMRIETEEIASAKKPSMSRSVTWPADNFQETVAI